MGYNADWDSGYREGIYTERERILDLLKEEEWDAPEIALPYVLHIRALIKGQRL